MKKMIKVAALFAVMVSVLAGCNMSTDSDSEEDAKKEAEKKELLNKKIAIYDTLVGTTWKIESPDCDTDVKRIDTIVFSDTSVTFDSDNYPVNKSTDLYFLGEEREIISILINNYYVTFYKESTKSYNGNDLMGMSWEYKNDRYISYEKISGGNGGEGGSGDISTVNGTYSFSDATGSQINGSITLSDGTWTLTDGKENAAAKSGTYTASGSKVTVKWTASSIEVTETFTLTTSGNSVTWSSENDYTSTFLSMLFGITGTEATFTKN